MKSGFDSVAETVAEWRSLVPASPEVIGAYANGRFANAQAAAQAFPGAIHYTYDVNGFRSDADVLDIERFDATVQQAPGWFRAWHQHKHTLPKPGFYISAGAVQTLIDTMTAAGIARDEYLILSAHYEHIGQHGAHICGPGSCGFPQADGTQWDDHGAQGQNTDRLLYNDQFFAAPVTMIDAAGHFNFAGSFFVVPPGGVWDIQGAPSDDVTFGSADQVMWTVIGVHTGGAKRGQWEHHPLPANWSPPGS